MYVVCKKHINFLRFYLDWQVFKEKSERSEHPPMKFSV